MNSCDSIPKNNDTKEWLAAIPKLKTYIDEYQNGGNAKGQVKNEKISQQSILNNINSSIDSDYYITDMEYSCPGIGYGRFDYVAINKKKGKDGKYGLALIELKYGAKGIPELNLDSATGKALISDDTQMTLFTADGIIRACNRGSKRTGSFTRDEIYRSYLRWYYTQTNKMPRNSDDCLFQYQPHEGKDSILNYKELFSERAPGISCLTALDSGKMGTIKQLINDSKGCGGVMRIAPIGLFLHNDPEYAFQVGCEVAAITHGHPTGYLSAGVLAAIIAELMNGKSILEGTLKAVEILKRHPNHNETLNMIEFAIELSHSDDNADDAILELGEGWVAEEALAIALYCALKEKDFKKALIMSVNHDGDSDSTGAICGNILGAYHGMEALPKEWVNNIELKALIVHMGNKLFDMENERNLNKNTNTEIKKIPKISRQLILLHIFLCSKVIQIKEITNLIKINNKTILRDLQQLV